MNKRQILTLVGFGLFLLGFIAIILNLVALNLSFLSWMDFFGPLASFLIKLGMAVGGIILAIAVNTKGEDSYDEYFDGDKFE